MAASEARTLELAAELQPILVRGLRRERSRNAELGREGGNFLPFVRSTLTPLHP